MGGRFRSSGGTHVGRRRHDVVPREDAPGRTAGQPVKLTRGPSIPLCVAATHLSAGVASWARRTCRTWVAVDDEHRLLFECEAMEPPDEVIVQKVS